MRTPSGVDAPRHAVDPQRASLELLARLRRDAAEDRVDARDELVVVERPHHEVVAAARERAHAVDRVGLRVADHDHRDVREPVERRLVAEQDEVGPRARRQLERLRPVVGAEHVEAVVGEVSDEEPPDIGLGLRDEDC